MLLSGENASFSICEEGIYQINYHHLIINGCIILGTTTPGNNAIGLIVS